jgi:predicted hotdog family 3-hydroxylacyl-ACP dehydratase
MLLISRVTEYSVPARTLRSEYDVSADCLFYDPALGGVPAGVSFEFMAQAVSALSGITGRVLGKPPMIGFILSVSALEIQLPLVQPPATVRVHVVGEMRLGAASTFRCEARLGERELARARLTVMDVEDPAQLPAGVF